MSGSENDDLQDLLDCAAEYENILSKELKTQFNNNDVPNKKRQRGTNITDIQEMPMEKAIFGDRSALLENMKAAVTDSSDHDTDEDKPNERKKRKPAWSDADDNDLTLGEVKKATRFTKSHNHLPKDKSYKDYITARYVRTMPQPKWASMERKAQREEDDEALLQTVGFLAKPDTNALQPAYINIKRLKDLNRDTYAEGAITSIQFIPKSTAAIVAGQSGIATIYSIDGVKNEKLHSLSFENFPIQCARLKPCGTKVIFGSKKRHYYVYDLLTAKEMRYILPADVTMLRYFRVSPCGRYMAVAGYLGTWHLFDAVSQELIHSFKQEDHVTAMCFTGDSKNVICHSTTSKVSIFSLTKQRLAHSFVDDGCIKGSTIDLSLDQRLFATGSREGVVNVYDFRKVQTTNIPQPEKTFFNLRTGISDIKFNHTAEILAMASVDVASAVKLAHFPTATVFANFPPRKSDIGKIRIVEFSPNSAYLALGNHHKVVNLLRLKHYNYY